MQTETTNSGYSIQMYPAQEVSPMNYHVFFLTFKTRYFNAASQNIRLTVENCDQDVEQNQS